MEYALDAYAAFAGSGTFNAQKRTALKALIEKNIAKMDAQLSGNEAKDAAEKPDVVSNKQLLQRLLTHIGGFKAYEPLPAKDVSAQVKDIKKLLKGKDREARTTALADIREYGSVEESLFV